MTDDQSNLTIGEIFVLTLCVFSATSVAYLFGSAALEVGLAPAIAHINEATDRSPWVAGVIWDITMFNLYVCAWFFYRENSPIMAFLASLAWWATGSIFLGAYILILRLKHGSFRAVLLGRHATESELTPSRTGK